MDGYGSGCSRGERRVSACDGACEAVARVERRSSTDGRGRARSCYLRDSRVPLLAVWGRNDQIFVPEGALAFADDAPAAELHLLDGGHFLLESHLDAAAGSIGRFLERALP
jgi:pimeloyl-ACP methyl ester carboxylesterase